MKKFLIILSVLYGGFCGMAIACESNEIDINGDGTECVNGKFAIKTTNLSNSDVFKFSLSASGTFTVNCGENGTLESEANDVTNGNTITRNDTTNTIYTCTYSTGGVKTIVFDGTATGYNGSTSYASSNFAPIAFKNNQYVASVYGDLSAMFPYLGSSLSQAPRFMETFSGNTNLTYISSTLFSNVTGAPRMFYSTFQGCTRLQSIPEELFSNITTGANDIFQSTFQNCTGLQSIPSGLFSSITTGADNMFSYTFRNCTGLQSIPGTLFSNITIGTSGMFSGTFQGCTGLESIPSGLFSNITTGATSMFAQTFNGCTGLQSIPGNLFSGINNTTNASYMFYNTFNGCTGLESIPGTLFSNITTGAEKMFGGTFQDCTGLESIPGTLFSNIATGARYVFDSTFKGCTGLQSLPSGLFSGITTGTENMFNYTFQNCTGLQSISSGLFSNITTGGYYMFYNTFNGCTGLQSIPAGLFSSITTGAYGMFCGTFQNCTGLQSIPSGLFSNITTGLGYMFNGTFQNCTGLQSIPAGLFSNVTIGAEGIFGGTFNGCNNIRGYIPPTTFGGLIANGSPTANNMWQNTFNGTQLVTECPVDTAQYNTGYEGTDTSTYTKLNGKVSCMETTPMAITLDTTGADSAASPSTVYVSYGTGWYSDAAGNNAITAITTLPTKAGKVFGGFYTGANATGTQVIDKDGNFISTRFTIEPITLYAYFSDGYTVTYSCGTGTGTPPASEIAVSGTEFAPVIPPSGCSKSGRVFAGWLVSGSTIDVKGVPFIWNYSENKTLTAQWFEPNFAVTTTELAAGDKFTFTMSAKGVFTINWGDGYGETIVRTNTTSTTYSHTYSTGGVKTIAFGGTAKEYNNSSDTGYQYAPIAFYNNKQLASVSGDLSAMFPYLGSSYSQYPRFMQTFYGNTNLTSIPGTLFNGYITGASGMFSQTFYGCTGLQSIPTGLFSGITTGASGMFSSTFYNCTGLQSIPSGLFSNITTSATSMFASTFYNCTGLQSIPGNLFSGITVGADSMFYNTFSYCTSLQSIPSGLFSNIASGADSMFHNTFSYCTSLQSIPSGLFSNITTGAYEMFYNTFSYCTGLQSIPAGLFSSIKTSAGYMFYNTFYGCTGLTAIPDNLFSGLTSGASRMFFGTFSGCSNIRGYIPSTTFDGLIANGAPTEYQMWSGTFSSTQLLEECPTDTVQYITGYEGSDYYTTWNGKVSCAESASSASVSVTYSCGDGTGTEPVATTATFGSEFIPATPTGCAYDDYEFAGWKVSGTNRIVNGTFTWIYSENKTLTAQWSKPKFAVTTTELAAGDTFTFTMTAKGTFTVDCGADGVLSSSTSDVSGNTITRSNTTMATYTCTYSTGGVKKIAFNGTATGYNSTTIAYNYQHSPIAFYQNTRVASISGDLSTIFPYLSNTIGEFPRFVQTFYQNTNLTSIPSTLFSGYTGGERMFTNTFNGCTSLQSIPAGLFNNVRSARKEMFSYTFSGCTSLQSIPSGLFSNITTGAESMFSGTFNGCTGIQSIPSGLFSNIRTSAKSMFGSTFNGCTGLQSIPSNLFSNITTGADSMFSSTFNGCTGLQSIPGSLFSNIATSAQYMFSSTFKGCTGLQSIPSGLFSNITTGADYMFQDVFNGCSNLSGYIPSTTFAGLVANGSPTTSYMWGNPFYNTQLVTQCPAGTTQYITKYESNWNSKVSCVETTPMAITLDTTGADTAASPSTVYVSYGTGWYSDSAGNNAITAITTLPTKTGKVFGGFYTGENATGIQVIDKNGNFIGTKLIPGPTTLYAYFGDAYTVTYSCGDGTGTPPTSEIAVYGTEFTPAASGGCDREGYVFSGWLISDTVIALEPKFTWTYRENKQLIAHWVRDDKPFVVKTVNLPENNSKFTFTMTAKGTFTVDCGEDGVLSGSGVSGNTITRTGASNDTYTCTYLTGGVKTIRFSGTATGYNSASGTGYQYAPISFYNNTRVASVFGDLSVMFPYLGSSKNQYPRFMQTFSGNTNLTYISSTLFSGYTDVSGANNMFDSTFYGCTGLESIPGTLFSNITTGAEKMFNGTFQNCTGLESIPGTLFSNITTGAQYMFDSTFKGCTGLQSISSGLFSNITTGGYYMFYNTFNGCTGLESIPGTLFSNITTGGSYMFYNTFNGCTGLQSLPAGLFSSITTGAYGMFWGTFQNCTGLQSIPGNLFSGITAGAGIMFYNTFSYCTSLQSIPAGLFSGITTGANNMFEGTFNGCSNIRGYIPPTTFAGLITNGSPTYYYMWHNTFDGTQLVTECPLGTLQYNTRYEGTDTSSYTKWNGKVSCAVSYSIDYELNDGVNYANAPVVYGYSTGATIDGVPTKDGYTFAGWCVDDTLTDCAMTQTITTTDTGNKTFYAKWTQCTACSATNASCELSIVNNICTYTTTCNDGYYDITNNGAYNASCSACGGNNYYCSGGVRNTVSSGYYSTGGTETTRTGQAQCASGTYCANGIQVNCPTGYDSSDIGAVVETQCYRACTTASVEHSLTVSGNDYYGDGADTCGAETCENGYTVKQYTLEEWLGDDASTGGGGYGYLDGWGQDSGYSDNHAAYQLLGSGDKWGVTFNYGIVKGDALCSSTSDMEIGNPSTQVGTNCYCRVNKLDNNFIQPVYWVYLSGGYGNSSTCKTMCPMYCASSINNNGSDTFRRKVFGVTNIGHPVCVGVTYNITYELDNGTNYGNAPTAYTYSVGASIDGVPTKDGYTFAGWCVDSGLTDCAMTQTIATTDSGNKTFYAKWMQCPAGYYCVNGSQTACPAGTYNSSTGATSDSACTTITSGYYGTGCDNNGTACTGQAQCTSGTYCANGVQNDCPTGYDSSVAGATSENQCYRACTTANVEHSATVSGNDYYGDGADTCSAQTCATGYKRVPPDLNTLIGTIQGTDVAAVGDSTADEYGYPNRYDIEYHRNAFAVDYGSNLGVVKGHGRCGTETGANTSNCYCKLDGYAPSYNSDTVTLSTPWVYHFYDSVQCGRICAYYCALDLYRTDSSSLAFRSNMFGAIQGATCEAESYAITYENMTDATNYSGAPSTYTYAVGATIDGVPTKSGHVFAGWCIDSELTDCAMTQTIATTDTGNKTFYAKWTQCPACSATNASCEFNSVVNNICTYTTSCNTGYGNIQNNNAYNASCSPNSYTITYENMTDATNYSGAPSTYVYGTGATIEGVPTKNDYTFMGWCTDSGLTDCAMTQTITTTDTGNKTFYAKWTQCTACSATNASCEFNGVVNNVCTYTTSCNTGYGNIQNNNAYNASCSPNTYNVTYSCGDGTGTPPVGDTAIYGVSFTSAANTCTRTGYAFAGWAVSGTNDVVADSFTWNYSENKTLTAQWFEPKFNVTTTNLAANDTFTFTMSATGTFNVDCGMDGVLSSSAGDVSGNTITRSNTTMATYTCTYSTGGVKTISFGGTATGYNSSTTVSTNAGDVTYSAIAFAGNNKVASIAGDLSVVFPYLGTATNQFPQFRSIFYSNTNLISVSDTLFSGYTIGVDRMFLYAFENCSQLTALPAHLFSNITTLQSANYIFYETFNSCSNLSGYIPPTTFAGLIANGSPTASSMWSDTFNNTQLVTECPSGTTQYITNYESVWNGKVSCKPAVPYEITLNTTGATTNANPNKLYIKYVNGAYRVYSDSEWVNEITGLTTAPTTTGMAFMGFYTAANGSGTRVVDENGDIITSVLNLFDENITVYAHFATIYNVTYSCGAGTGTAPTAETVIDGTTFTPATPDNCVNSDKVFDGWAVSDTADVKTDAFTWNYAQDKVFTAQWRDPGFQITTTSTSQFKFKISASGTFTVDCGDGGTLTSTANDVTNNDTITRNGTSVATYTCSWGTAGVRTVTFGGRATGYNTGASKDTAAISFNTQTSDAAGYTNPVAAVSGSIGAVFPTLGSGNANIPIFYGTFKQCRSLESVPSNLFNGVTGVRPSMFRETFDRCDSLATVPGDLLSGIQGEGQESMFRSMFYTCKSLTNMPDGLFSGVTTGADSLFKYTFYGDTSMDGYIPPSTFAGLIANHSPTASNMWQDTFGGDNTLATSCPGMEQYITGYESSWNSKVSCWCGGATYLNDEGSCSSCPTGYDADTTDGKTLITQCKIHCNAGTYIANANDATCSDAGVGYYAAASDVVYGETSEHTACPEGFTTEGAQSASASACNISTLVCQGATYNDNGTCVACPTGYDADTTNGKTLITQCKIHCNAGTYIANANDTTCTDVGRGYYAAAADIAYGDSETHDACPAGTTTTGTNSTSIEACAGCSGAMYLSNHECVACPSGYDADTTSGKSSITQCKIHCNAGTYIANANDTTCSAVGVDYYAAAADIAYGSSETRTACPANSTTAGTHASSIIDCLCEGSRYMNNGTCVDCPEGYTSDTEIGKTLISQCKIHCNAGTYLESANDTTCTDVGKGFYATASDISYGSVGSRTSCDTGYTTIGNKGTGSNACVLLAASCTGATYWQEIEGVGTCVDCPTGYIGNVDAGKQSINQCQISCSGGTVPDNYTMVEFLENSGSMTEGQFIDTGYKIKSDKVVINTVIGTGVTRDTSGDVGNIFGNQTSGKGFSGSYKNMILGFWHDGGTGNKKLSSDTVSLVVDTQYKVDYAFNGVNRTMDIEYDDANGNHTQHKSDAKGGNNMNNDKSFHLFSNGSVTNNNGTLTFASGDKLFARGRIYSLKLTDNDVLVLDLVPVKRNSDNVVGMYNKVNGEFYTNGGTGTFTVGTNGNSFAGSVCNNVGDGYYIAANTTNYGSTAVTPNKCPNDVATHTETATNIMQCEGFSCTTGKYYDMTLDACTDCAACDATNASCALNSVVNNICTYTTSCDTGYDNIQNNGEYNPVCSAATYNITYDLRNGTNYVGAPTTYTYGVGATVSGTPSRSGYGFIGWCTDSTLQNCASTQTIAANATGDKVFYAKWAEIYYITYELDGGTNYSNYPTSYTYSVGATIDGTPTKQDYSFVGWCTDSGLQNCSLTQTIDGSTSGDTIFYAKWEEAPSDVVCAAGTYLPANSDTCATCLINSYCEGGTYILESNVPQGIVSCASGLFAPTGMWESAQCGRKLHIGNDVIYLRQTRQTEHTLNIEIGNTLWYGNMTTADVPMNVNTDRSLHVKFDNTTYSVYDDTVTVPE